MDVDDIETVAVLGAGTMGHGIAEVAALAGFDVRLRDVEEEFVQRGLERVEWSLDKLVADDQITRTEADGAFDRLAGVVDLTDAVADADVVVEAVPERMDVKKDVYRELEEYAPEDAMFATNTSSLSITELSEATDRPERFCGMHFFNPPVRMQLVEVIAGAHTAEETLETVGALAEAMGKTPVRVDRDSPGFVVNRVLAPLLNEAAWLVSEGEATVAEVDSSAKFDLGLPMGVFELADQIGIDVACDILDYMHDVLGDAYEPCPLLLEQVERGDLGKKTDAGFYDYNDGSADVPPGEGREDVVRWLQAVMANEVAKLVGGDVADPRRIDEALRLGANFPDGPARMADDVGLAALYEALLDRREATGAARYAPADELERRAEEDVGFYETEVNGGTPSYGTIRVEKPGDGVGRIVLDREHRMNTVTAEMLDELADAVDAFEADEEVRALLLTGAGDRAFSAGADVQALAGSATSTDAVELSRKGQRVFGKLERAGVPVVAGIDGYCLGGGMELATAADLRVASDRSELGQPEHDLGLLPGWGGTQRLRHVVGEGRAKEIIFTADRYDAEEMASYGFVNEVVPAEEFEDRVTELARDLAAGPPLAQRYTKRAMLAGRGDADAGLEVEALGFGHLFDTEDLMEGISAFVDDREPEFEGK